MLMAQKLFWCLIVSLTAQVVVLAQTVSPVKQVETEALVEKAMEHGYVDGDIGSASRLLIQAVRLSPDDGELERRGSGQGLEPCEIDSTLDR